MRRIIQLAKIILVFFGVLFLVNILYPGIISGIISVLPFDDTQWSFVLAGIDILVAILIAGLTSWEQNEEKKRCQYKFELSQESMRFNEYYALDNIGADSYSYVFNSKNQEIEVPYHTINVPITEKHCASVNLPLILTVQRCPDGEKMEINSVYVSVEQNGKQIRTERVTDLHCVIGSNITNGMKYLLRISLLCNFAMEKHLLNSRYIISMRITYYDWRNRKLPKFVAIEIQSVGGKKIIKQVVSHNSYARHIIWWLSR